MTQQEMLNLKPGEAVWTIRPCAFGQKVAPCTYERSKDWGELEFRRIDTGNYLYALSRNGSAFHRTEREALAALVAKCEQKLKVAEKTRKSMEYAREELARLDAMGVAE